MNSPILQPARLAPSISLGHSLRVDSRFTLALLLLLATFARAADWKVQLLNAGDPIREGGPIPLRLQITNPTRRPVEGRIEASLQSNGATVVHHVSQPIVLVPGPQIIPHLLPPCRGEPGVERNAILVFITGDAAIPLGVFPLPFESGARFVIAHVKNEKRRETDTDLARSLNLDSLPLPFAKPAPLAPEIKKAFTRRRSNLEPAEQSAPSFRALWLTPDDVPTDPLALGAYDGFVLHPDALANLRPRQFEAIAQWVDAGGRLLVFASERPDSTPLGHPEPVAAFLRRLSLDQPELHWTLSSSGQFVELADGPRFVPTGCGRTAIFANFDAFTDSLRLLTMNFLTGRTWEDELISGPSDGNTAAWDFPGLLPALLLPSAPRPIAISTILASMLGFIAVAAAGDYLFLGWLRRRKYTWLLFPVLAAAATAATIAFAHRHMNALAQRGTLRVVDLGTDGRVLREHRFTAILPSRTETAFFESDHALSREFQSSLPPKNEALVVTTVVSSWNGSTQTVSRTSRYGSLRGSCFDSDPPAARWPPQNSIVSIEGHLASTSRHQLSLQQWTPLMLHSYSPGSNPDDSGLHWEQWQPVRSLWQTRQEHPHRSPGPIVVSKVFSITPPQRATLDPSSRYTFLSSDRVTDPPDAVLATPGKFAALIRDCSTQYGGFHRPPAGELLPALINYLPNKDSQTVLFAFLQEGSTFTCYRKLYHVAADDPPPR